MTNIKIKKYIYGVAIILIIIIGLIIINIYNVEDELKNENSDSNTNSITNIQPGPAGRNCEKNADCEDLCGNGECLIASCSISGVESAGECICLDTCSIEGF